LDDVMSELDAGRRTSLLEGMKEAQVFVTCTEAGHIASQLDALLGAGGRDAIHYYHVADGSVTPLGGRPG
jgi:recombinational DNA repair ATPase RecF